MLFNSATFLFGFLPIVLAGYLILARLAPRWGTGWLAIASLAFYGWADARLLTLLLGSITVNFLVGRGLARRAAAAAPVGALLACGLAFNLGLLVYFKYANFFLRTANEAFGTGFPALGVVLPLGISFFTFTQIAFLVDASRGLAREYNPVHYALFVSYFPHLVAGPILHHREMMPQFAQPAGVSLRWEDFAAGLSILCMGLFKKVVLADGLAPYAEAAFSAAEAGRALAPLDAWVGALAYTFQLYFDFSGYSDMAIGISLLFGVRLPINFDSPYKARNIADFWRRWHVTLSRFLRDYLYVPLGGNRRGPCRVYFNLLVTMLLGGLWHGAGWTFVAWGALHGAYLALHRAYRGSGLAARVGSGGPALALACTVLTFLCVVIAWVFFRAESVNGAFRMLSAMGGFAPDRGVAAAWGARHLAVLGVLYVCVLSLPNTQEVMARSAAALPVYRPIGATRPAWMGWKATWPWLGLVVACGWAALYRVLSGRESPFLYFNF